MKVIHYVIMPTHIHMTVEISKELPVITRGKHKERYHLGRIIGYMKSGTTTWYRRLLLGESVEDILARPNWRDIYNEDGSRKDHPADDTHQCQRQCQCQRLTTDVNNDVNNDANNGASREEHTGAPIDEAKIKKISLWEQGYNDKILNTHRKLSEWIYYEDKNPYFWKIEEEYPDLFEKRLHINTDRDACSKVLMLALAPWSIPKTEASGNIPAETNYAKFHDLNILAVRMCDEITDMQMVSLVSSD